MIICRTGIFKYATANKIYGYELHLERINSLHKLNTSHLKNQTRPTYYQNTEKHEKMALKRSKT